MGGGAVAEGCNDGDDAVGRSSVDTLGAAKLQYKNAGSHSVQNGIMNGSQLSSALKAVHICSIIANIMAQGRRGGK